MKQDNRASLPRRSAAAFTVLVACSSPTTAATHAGSMGDSGGEDTGTSADGGSSSCNTLAAPAAITHVKIAAAPPVAQGGTVADGTYVATAFTTYTGAGGAGGPDPTTLSAVIQTAGNTWQFATSDNGSAAHQATATVTFLAKTVMQTFTCPSSSPVKSQDYAATSTELRLYTGRNAGVDEVVLTKK